MNICRLLDRAQVTAEEEKVEDEEDNDLLKAFKVCTTFMNEHGRVMSFDVKPSVAEGHEQF